MRTAFVLPPLSREKSGLKGIASIPFAGQIAHENLEANEGWSAVDRLPRRFLGALAELVKRLAHFADLASGFN